MITAWTEAAWEEYLQWQKEDEKILGSINNLIKDIKRDPFKGLGNQSPLNTPYKDGGLDASQASTVWFIAFQVRAKNSKSISLSVDTIIETVACFEMASNSASTATPLSAARVS